MAKFRNILIVILATGLH